MAKSAKYGTVAVLLACGGTLVIAVPVLYYW